MLGLNNYFILYKYKYIFSILHILWKNHISDKVTYPSVLLLIAGIFNIINLNSQEHLDLATKKVIVDNINKKAIHAFNNNSYDSAIFYYKKAIPLFADLNNWSM